MQAWITVLAASLAPIVAIGGSIIAYRQYQAAREKLKLDLFDKRFEVLRAVSELLAHIIVNGRCIWNEIDLSYRTAARGQFLFDDKAWAYIDEIRKAVYRLNILSQMLKDLPVGKERTDAAADQSELVRKVFEFDKRINEVFIASMRIRT